MYLIYFSLFVGSKVYGNSPNRLTFASVLLAVGVGILSIIFGGIWIGYQSTTCSIQNGIECGALGWAIFGFFIFSPLLGIFTGIITKIVSPKIFGKEFVSKKVFITLSVIFLISNLLLGYYLNSTLEKHLVNKDVTETQEKTKIAKESEFVCQINYDYNQTFLIEDNKIYDVNYWKNGYLDNRVDKKEIGFAQERAVNLTENYHITHFNKCYNNLGASFLDIYKVDYQLK